MSKEIDINFLIKSIQCFRDFRNENLEVFLKTYRRLENLSFNSDRNYKPTINRIPFYKKTISIILIGLRQIIRAPKYIIQTINLRNSNCKDINSCTAFSIASSRLDLDKDDCVTSQIEQLTEVIGGNDSFKIFSRNDDEKKTIILYDPQIESGFWDKKKVSKYEKIFIFDGCYIIFLSVWLLISGIFFRNAREFAFIKKYLQKTRIKKDNKKIVSSHIRVIEALSFIAYSSVINKFPKHLTILLTSNSFFVELLRAYILQNAKSGRIIELLHGIIADPTEKWFFNLLSDQESYGQKKHTLIPQVPDLPELSIIKKRYFEENDVSINTYMNAFLYKNKKLYRSYEDMAHHYCNQLKLCPNKKDLILTFYGGTSIQGNFFNSSAFHIESKILMKSLDYFLNKNLDIKIIYVPHPSNKTLPKNVEDMFKNLKVQTLEQSIFTYLITDYCVSNISSCLFELNWLGAKCFSPLIEADGFYSKRYLETIYYPKSNGVNALEIALYNCFEEGISLERENIMDKINSRIIKIKGRL